MIFYKVPEQPHSLFIAWGGNSEILDEYGFEKQDRIVDLDKDGNFPIFNSSDLIMFLATVKFGNSSYRSTDNMLAENNIDTYSKLKDEYIKVKHKVSNCSRAIRLCVIERYETITKLHYGTEV